MPSSPCSLIWFRQDLRLTDNPALLAARQEGAVMAVFILDPVTERGTGAAGRWWLHHSLRALSTDLTRHNIPLILVRGGALDRLFDIVHAHNITAVHWNRLYDPASIERDTAIKSALKEAGVAVQSHNAALLFEPWVPKTRTGGAYKVFSRFWQHCRNDRPAPPAPCPKVRAQDSAPVPVTESETLQDWALLPGAPDWSGGLSETWRPGEAGAWQRLETFLEVRLADYAEGRDFPGRQTTSCLSPHLRFGEIGPRQILGEINRRGLSADKFLSEIGWREFAHNLLYQHPALDSVPMKPEYDTFPWIDDRQGLLAWQKGLTGYPIVDAGMRELWHTGYMHNRVRMITASFLVKDLLVAWQQGAAWFADTLVDADAANNAAGWQWVAGCGADAAPYFRIFNPVSQGEKFDPGGLYVRRWIPELTQVPDQYIHQPWTAPDPVLRDAGLTLGGTYPCPIVDHKTARDRALNALKRIKKTAS